MNTLKYLKVKYYFYHNNTKTTTLKDLLGTLRTLKGTISTFKGLLVSLCGLSSISHVVVCLEIDDYQVFVHSSHGTDTVWSSQPPLRPPDRVLVEEGEMETGLLDLILPSGEPYSLTRMALFYLTGYPRYTINCVTVVHRIRFLLGKETRRRTPGGLYRELIRQEQVFHQ